MIPNSDPKDLLERIKNITLDYNTKVTPRRQVLLERSTNVFDVLMSRNPLENERNVN